MLKSEEYYPSISPEIHRYYNQGRSWKPAQLMSKELALLKDKERKLLVEIGCAAGQSLEKYIDSSPFKRYIVVDVSEKMAKYTEQLYKEQGIKISSLCVNLENEILKIRGNSASAVVASGTLYYLKNLENVFKQAKKVLTSEGIFAFDILINNPSVRSNGFVYPNINTVCCYSIKRSSIDTLASKYSFNIKKKIILEEETVVRNEREIGDHVLYVLQKK